MVYQIGICNGEAELCEEIEQYVRDFFHMRNDKAEVSVWYTGEGCCKNLKDGIEIDILFLNVILSVKNGIEVGRFIRENLKNNSMHIIYFSELTNCIPELFRIHPYDFMKKPVKQSQVFQIMEELILGDEHDEKCFVIQKRKGMDKIPYKDIHFFSSQKRHIQIHLTDGCIREFNGHLKEIISIIPKQFVMVSQSYIVNLEYIKTSKYDRVIMYNNEVINITRPNRVNFRKKMKLYYEKSV